jgi:tetratricopeptide (TPR) repeat protein
MDNIVQRIVQLAEIYKDPDEFIHVLEELPMPSNEKGSFFFEVGAILRRLSYLNLALNSWDHALKYFAENNEEAEKLACYGNIGNIYRDLEDFDKAIPYYMKSLESAEKIDDEVGKSKGYGNLGFCYRNLGCHRKAIGYFEKSLRIARKAGDVAEELVCCTNLGVIHRDLGDYRTTIKFHKKSLRIARECGNKTEESKSYKNLGTSYYCLGSYKKTIEYCEKSLQIAEEVDDTSGKSECYKALGIAYYNRGYFRKAIEYYEKLLEIARESDDDLEESDCYTNLGVIHNDLGDYEKAIGYLEKSLKTAREVDDKSGESICYISLGSAYHGLGEYEKANEYYEKSMQIAEETKDVAGELACLMNFGLAYRDLGDYRRAIEYLKKSLKIAEEINDDIGKSKSHGNLGSVYNNIGDYREAIGHLEKSLEIAKKIGNIALESQCYVILGNIHQNIGYFEKTIEYYKKSLKIAKKMGNKVVESRCYGNLGIVYCDLGNFEEAIENHEKSLKIAEEIGDKASESKCYANLGSVYSRRGDHNSSYFEKAIQYYEKSLKIAEEIGDKASESVCYTNIGNMYYELGKSEKAILLYEKSLKIDEETGNMDSERIDNLALTRIYYESEPELAFDYCNHSIELLEMISGRLAEEEYKIVFSTRAYIAYQFMVPLCLKLEKEEKAFEYTERSKLRAFLDSLAATEIKPTSELTDELQSLLNDEEMYLAKLREIQTQHLRPTKHPMGPEEVEKIHENLTTIYDKIKKFDPEYVFLRSGRPLSLNDIRNILFSQKRDVVLIEYFMTEDETFIFVISSNDKELHVKTIPLSKETLSQYLENYWREVVECHGKIGDTWLGLSDYLIEPISEYIPKGSLVYFVPYGLLHYFPLHALEFKGDPLIKRHPVAYVPSASLFEFCQSKGSGNLETCASFGVAFEEEAEDIAELFGSRALSGSSISKDTIVQTCTNKDIIHFSCHGLFDDIDPLSSGIILDDKATSSPPDRRGILTAREILDMRLNTELVTLSACQTGLNRRSPGDELIGLTRAFLYAGAPSVIVSLWSVNARSTYDIMLEFYTQLKNGSDKATALQEAQKAIMEKEEYSHPYYWAPFVLVGDWE